MSSNSTQANPDPMRYPAILCLLLALFTAGIYNQTGGHGFINFDDTGHVTDNPRVQGGLTPENVVWAFTATSMSNWHPLRGYAIWWTSICSGWTPGATI